MGILAAKALANATSSAILERGNYLLVQKEITSANPLQMRQ